VKTVKKKLRVKNKSNPKKLPKLAGITLLLIYFNYDEPYGNAFLFTGNAAFVEFVECQYQQAQQNQLI
jgi:hypothetical protein